MQTRRIKKVNSLLKEVISDVIQKQVKNPHLPSFITITQVEVSKDLHHAKVYVSVIGTDTQKNDAIAILQSAAGFIAIKSSQQIVLRFFPELTFHLDNSAEKQEKIEKIILEIQEERKHRKHIS